MSSNVRDWPFKWPIPWGQVWVEPLLRRGSDGRQVSARIIDDDVVSRFGGHWFLKDEGRGYIDRNP